jgi:hypothetical protein
MSRIDEMVEHIRGRIHSELDGECHLTDTEAHAVADLLSELDADYLRRHKDATDRFLEIQELRQLLSEAEKREREAREKLQAMHRRAQESERVEQMVATTMKMYDRYITVGVRSHRILFKIVLRDLLRSAEKIRSRRALQSEER